MEGTGLAMNTVPPNDFGHYEMLDALVQMEPAEALNTELAGQFAAIGIVKGEKFAPDPRLRDDPRRGGSRRQRRVHARSAWARTQPTASATTTTATRPGGACCGSAGSIHQPPADDHRGRRQAVPEQGARQLHSRTSFFYTATGITPAMCMRLTNVGSQYLVANVDATGNPSMARRPTGWRLPKDIPAARFWSLTLYDNQTRSMLQTPQRYPRAGSQMFPSPAADAEPDGSTVVYFCPTQPDGVAAGNWIQTDPTRGWFVILRLYSPLQPFFDKTWRPGEIELVH